MRSPQEITLLMKLLYLTRCPLQSNFFRKITPLLNNHQGVEASRKSLCESALSN